MFEVLFNHTQQTDLRQVTDRLVGLEGHPDRLALEMDHRYDDPPPPYPESGETTQPPSPTSPEGPIFDKYAEQFRLKRIFYKTMPLEQFKSQAHRESNRLMHQLSERLSGRRQTLPWDMSRDFQANSENNVRARWCEQGIWANEWGPAWPRDSSPMKLGSSCDGPFDGSQTVHISESTPGARWGHENGPEPVPEPDPKTRRSPGPWIWGMDSAQPSGRELPKPVTAPPPLLTPRGPIPRPTVENPEASRPKAQFLYQMAKEREWIRDENDHNPPGRAVDLDAEAYESVRANWVADKVWDPDWDELPGPSWVHEGDLIAFVNRWIGAKAEDSQMPQPSSDASTSNLLDRVPVSEVDSTGCAANRRIDREMRGSREHTACLEEDGSHEVNRSSRRQARSISEHRDTEFSSSLSGTKKRNSEQSCQGEDELPQEASRHKRVRTANTTRTASSLAGQQKTRQQKTRRGKSAIANTTNNGPRRSARIAEKEQLRKAQTAASTATSKQKPIASRQEPAKRRRGRPKK